MGLCEEEGAIMGCTFDKREKCECRESGIGACGGGVPGVVVPPGLRQH